MNKDEFFKVISEHRMYETEKSEMLAKHANENADILNAKENLDNSLIHAFFQAYSEGLIPDPWESSIWQSHSRWHPSLESRPIPDHFDVTLLHISPETGDFELQFEMYHPHSWESKTKEMTLPLSLLYDYDEFKTQVTVQEIARRKVIENEKNEEEHEEYLRLKSKYENNPPEPSA